MNGVLKSACRLPIRAIVQVTFHRPAKYFFDRLSKGRRMLEKNQPLPDKVLEVYHSSQEYSLHHEIHKFDLSDQSASVKTLRLGSARYTTHVVNLRLRECTCGKWKHNGIPCSHAMQTCRHFGVNPTVFIAPYYSTSAYVETYRGRFVPLPDEYYWDEPSFELLHNPTLREKRRRGRDRTTRIWNEMDWPEIRARQQYRASQDDPCQPETSTHHR